MAGPQIRVRGVQRYTTGAQSKNSADLAIAADATEDFVLGRASMVAVVSNDSDFCALFVKIREMSIDRGFKRTPFVWVVSTGGGVLSPEVRRFVPDEFRWELAANGAEEARGTHVKIHPQVSGKNRAPAAPSSGQDSLSHEERIARAIVRHMPVGTFRASDAEKIAKRYLPGIPVPSNQARFAKYLLDEVSPVLETLGVEVNRKQKSSKRYKITEASKRRV